ncbi:MAG: hypothetical protein M3373_10480 [Gemmatimonadota bacterium]|nr:hypothetical protein [Gemmatimonadota bacterium]
MNPRSVVGVASTAIAVAAGLVANHWVSLMAAFLIAAAAFVLADTLARRLWLGPDAPPFGVRELALAMGAALLLGTILTFMGSVER